ncbi:MAG: NAD(P)-dependent dehydrogenase (short-subunit alcohol dehydrogenase family) [Hyphomicrobiaceae bacterium]|jgi:NAD(P)-dependent dehydrogenase (short-subunit alcohol dehydrogenase family)
MGDLFDLTGKTIVVTGGSRGLGLAMARAFAARGANLVIASRKLEVCQAVADELRNAHGVRVLPFGFHAGNWDGAKRLLDATIEEFGRLDVLVNNAGMSPLYPSLTEISEELWHKVLSVNLMGPFRLATLAAERMAAADGGSIINVSSVGAVQPTTLELPYAMAKSALHTMAAGMAHDYRGRVRCNVIMPGAFLTDISNAWPPEMHEAMNSMIPMGRCGEPDEIVGAALYLASDASSYTSGAVIKVDGGWAYRAS